MKKFILNVVLFYFDICEWCLLWLRDGDLFSVGHHKELVERWCDLLAVFQLNFLLGEIIFAIQILPLKLHHEMCMHQFLSIRKILTEPHPGKWNCIDLNGGIEKSSVHSNSMMPSMGFLVVVVRAFDSVIEHVAEMVVPDRPVDYLSGLQQHLV